MSDYFEVMDETDPGSILDGDTLIHTDKIHHVLWGSSRISGTKIFSVNLKFKCSCDCIIFAFEFSYRWCERNAIL